MVAEVPRHQCLIYDGAPSRHLPELAGALREKLTEGFRCLYLDSPPMIAGMRSYLAQAGVDVAWETEAGRLVLSPEREHLKDGKFDIDRMMDHLAAAVAEAVDQGFTGLWATGNMTWEFGPEKDFAKLLEYERRLEDYIRGNPRLGGVCQYHVDTLPRTAIREALVSHPAIFVNQTLSQVNPHFMYAKQFSRDEIGQALDVAIDQICRNVG